MNLGVNIRDFLRLSGGYGTFTSSTLFANAGIPLGEESLRFTSYGGGARLLVPGWSLSPSAGLSYVHVKVASSTSGIVASEFGGGAGGHAHAAVGLDLTLRFGLHAAAGWNHSLKPGIGGMPYLNLGWFF